MPESWGMIIASVISGMFSGVVTGLVTAVKIVNSRMEKSDQKVEKLTETVDDLKKERIEKLEITINDHVKGDQTQRFITSMEHMTGAVTKMDSRMDGKFDSVVKELSNLSSKVQGQDEKIEALKDYVHNLDESHQRCKALHKV